jgi:hypothetical protein
MEHSLHLAAKHFVQTIAPPSSKKNATSGTDLDHEAASDDDNDKDEGLDSGDSLQRPLLWLSR